MKKTHGKHKRIQLLVNQNHSLDNMHKILPNKTSQKVFNKKNNHIFHQIPTNFLGNIQKWVSYHFLCLLDYSRFVCCKDRELHFYVTTNETETLTYLCSSDGASRLGLASQNPFFEVSVSKVSGLVSKDFGLGLDLFVSRLCIKGVRKGVWGLGLTPP